MSGDVDIVPVPTTMARELARLHASAFHEAWDESAFARLLGADACLAFAACEGAAHTPVGFIVAFCAAGEAEILTLAVHPDRRRRGLSVRLVRALIDAAQQADAEVVHLEVAEDNWAARSLYRQLGFIERGRRKSYYAARVGEPARDALMLSLPLAPPITGRSRDERLYPH
jgi:ribosomal-protein-alanine N-acetyltransferase